MSDPTLALFPGRTEAEVKAEALREAAIEGAIRFAKDHRGEIWALGRALIDQSWLLARADSIEAEA